MNLLIVDDEISSIRAVSHMLDWETIGIDRCFTALSAAEARQCMEENQIDLLLCDIEMPQQSGLELLEWVNEQQLQISCVYMTCYAEFSYAQKAIQLGSEAYLLKPIDPEELKSVLTAAIQKRQALQAAQSASRLMEEDCDSHGPSGGHSSAVKRHFRCAPCLHMRQKGIGHSARRIQDNLCHQFW